MTPAELDPFALLRTIGWLPWDVVSGFLKGLNAADWITSAIGLVAIGIAGWSLRQNGVTAKANREIADVANRGLLLAQQGIAEAREANVHADEAVDEARIANELSKEANQRSIENDEMARSADLFVFKARHHAVGDPSTLPIDEDQRELLSPQVGQGLIELDVQNSGLAPAYDVDFEVADDSFIFSCHGVALASIPPGHRESVVFTIPSTVYESLDRLAGVWTFAVKATYFDRHDERQQVGYRIKFEGGPSHYWTNDIETFGPCSVEEEDWEED